MAAPHRDNKSMIRKHPLRALWTLVVEPLMAVALVFVSTTAIAQPFYVPTGSMQPTLAIGDAGAANAGLLAAQILATADEALAQRIIAFRAAQTEAVLAAELPEP